MGHTDSRKYICCHVVKEGEEKERIFSLPPAVAEPKQMTGRQFRHT